MSEDPAILRSTPKRLGYWWVAAWIFLIGGSVYCRLENVIRIAPAVPIVLLGLSRRRVPVWSAAVAMVLLTIYVNVAPKDSLAAKSNPFTTPDQLAVNLIDIVLVAWVTDQAILYYRSSRQRQETLTRQNQELAASRAEVARQNQFLQEQSQRLARQSHSLASLLELSRAQATVTERGRMIQQLCRAARDMFRNLNPTILIREQVGDVLQVTCHEGSGKTESGAAPIAMSDPAVAACLAAEEPDAITDLSAPTATKVFGLSDSSDHDGSFAAVLSAPLRGRHQRGGLLQVYSPQRHVWTDDEKSLITSLAAQAAVSLETFGLFAELERRRAAAEDEAIRKGRFLAAASHDIRTPANAISLLAELLQQSAVSDDSAGDVPELARELHKSAAMLVSLAGDVLDVTRLDTGKVDLQISEFAMADLITDVCRQQKVIAEQRGLGLSCDGVEPGLVVRTDRVKLARVLANLITNGIKFTDQGHVLLRCAVRPDGQVALDVSDTGIGIAAEFQEKVFDEYFQLRRPSRERERGGGSGLGLAICRRLVATMGGRLEVHSQPGNGSTFSVLLPASTIVCTAAADSVAAAKAPSVAAS